MNRLNPKALSQTTKSPTEFNNLDHSEGQKGRSGV